MRESSAASSSTSRLTCSDSGSARACENTSRRTGFVEVLKLLLQLGRDLVVDERHAEREYSIRARGRAGQIQLGNQVHTPTPKRRAKNHEEGTGSAVRKGTNTRKITTTAAR